MDIFVQVHCMFYSSYTFGMSKCCFNENIHRRAKSQVFRYKLLSIIPSHMKAPIILYSSSSSIACSNGSPGFVNLSAYQYASLTRALKYG